MPKYSKYLDCSISKFDLHHTLRDKFLEACRATKMSQGEAMRMLIEWWVYELLGGARQDGLVIVDEAYYEAMRKVVEAAWRMEPEKQSEALAKALEELEKTEWGSVG